MSAADERTEPMTGVRILGTKGFLKGEERTLGLGETVVVGRSRSADISVKRATKFLARKDRAQIARTKRFLSVSRRHVRIHFMHPDFVEVVDLSNNGTLVDGRRVDRIALTDLRERPHVLSLNGVEDLRLEWIGAPSDNGGPQTPK